MKYRPLPSLVVLAALCLPALGCIDGGGLATGIAPTHADRGPVVQWDLDAKPLPEVPFPNDVATRVDPTSPTGLRINLSLFASTEVERRIRRKAMALTGFGVFAPMWVGFEAPLHVGRIKAAHDNAEWTDDVAYVVNVDRDSAHFGRFTRLDLGSGHYPVLIERRDRYFEGDPRANTTTLLFETTDEDLDGDGILDPGEDTDGDGVLDRPNVWPAGADAVDGLSQFYEHQTNTLMIRVQEPLAQRATHAVVLTRRLVGLDGAPVVSPFPFVNHVRQTEDLEPLAELLPNVGATLDDVAFAWTFTTQDITGELEALRAGLYGHGAFKGLAREYPAELAELHPMYPDDADRANLFALDPAPLISLLQGIGVATLEVSEASAEAFGQSLKFVESMVSGTFESPNLLVDKDGFATDDRPADEDESFDMDISTGRVVQVPGVVPFWCTIPKEGPGRQQPFPVAIFQHGYGSTRGEMALFGGSINRHGIAACSTDAPAHGLVVGDSNDQALVDTALAAFPDLAPVVRALLAGRARDLNNDGVADSGGDYWVADVFHVRDIVRQSVIDIMQLVRIIRSFDGERRWGMDVNGDGTPELAGDFDGNGVVDFGGSADFFLMGGSLGGILTGVAAAMEPTFVAAAPIVGAAGLADTGIRTTLNGVVEAAIMPMMGPMIVARAPAEDGSRDLMFMVPDVADRAELTFANVPAGSWSPGDLLEVHNQTNDEIRSIPLPEAAAIRVHFPADAVGVSERAARLKLPVTPVPDVDLPSVPEGMLLGDVLTVRIRRPGAGGESTIVHEVTTFERPVDFMGHRWPEGATLVSPAEGFGHLRATPDLRRFFAVAQTILDVGDPAGYAPHHFLDPLEFPYDDAEPGAHMLYVPTIGDMGVPVNTGIAMARAGGAIGWAEHRTLIQTYVVEGIEGLNRWTDSEGTGVLLDPDNLSDGTDGFDVPRLDPPLRSTVDDGLGGVSGLRMPYMSPRGQHGFGAPSPHKPFDMDTFAVNMIGRFFQLRGAEISVDRCLADNSCDFIPPIPE